MACSEVVTGAAMAEALSRASGTPCKLKTPIIHPLLNAIYWLPFLPSFMRDFKRVMDESDGLTDPENDPAQVTPFTCADGRVQVSGARIAHCRAVVQAGGQVAQRQKVSARGLGCRGLGQWLVFMLVHDKIVDENSFFLPFYQLPFDLERSSQGLNAPVC